MITSESVRRILHYNPLDGEFVWIKGGRFNRLSGKQAGCVGPDGYRSIRINGVLYQAHRLAWLYMTGVWPPNGFVDHYDTNPLNNRWRNLRDATKTLNQENRRKARKDSISGLIGVSPNKKRWSASITSEYRRIYIGTFDTPELAHAAYVREKRKIHPGCTL